MDWKKVLQETDDRKLSLKEFAAQAVIVGVALIGGFWIAGVLTG